MTRFRGDLPHRPQRLASTSSSSASIGAEFEPTSSILLVSELQNQDPLNATSTTDFINQLTSYANFNEQQSMQTPA